MYQKIHVIKYHELRITFEKTIFATNQIQLLWCIFMQCFYQLGNNVCGVNSEIKIQHINMEVEVNEALE